MRFYAGMPAPASLCATSLFRGRTISWSCLWSRFPFGLAPRLPREELPTEFNQATANENPTSLRDVPRQKALPSDGAYFLHDCLSASVIGFIMIWKHVGIALSGLLSFLGLFKPGPALVGLVPAQ